MIPANRNCPICGSYSVFYLEDKDESIYQYRGHSGDIYCTYCNNVSNMTSLYDIFRHKHECHWYMVIDEGYAKIPTCILQNTEGSCPCQDCKKFISREDADRLIMKYHVDGNGGIYSENDKTLEGADEGMTLKQAVELYNQQKQKIENAKSHMQAVGKLIKNSYESPIQRHIIVIRRDMLEVIVEDLADYIKHLEAALNEKVEIQ